MNTKLIRRILDVSSVIAIGSGLADLILWFKVGAMIPSWTMTIMAICSTVLIQVIRHKVI